MQAKLASQIPLDNPSRKAAEDDKSKGGLLNPKAPGKAQTGNPLASGISEQTNGNKTVRMIQRYFKTLAS